MRIFLWVALKVVPLILVLLYAWFALKVGNWYMDLPKPTGEQTTFTSTIWGAAAIWFGLYQRWALKVRTEKENA